MSDTGDTMNDDEIIKTADNWEKQRQAERRRTRIVLKRTLAGVAAAGGLFSVLFWAIPLVQEKRAARKAEEYERRENYEQAWATCVSEVGPDVCNAVEARLADRCLEMGSTVKRCLSAELPP